jgi:DNA or RNA helicases of superfamily II
MSCEIVESVLKSSDTLPGLILRSSLVPIGYSLKNIPSFPITDFPLTIEQKRVVDEIKTNSFMLHLPTGYGKTVLGIFLASRCTGKVLILVPRKIIFDQWMERIKQFSSERIEDFEVKLQISFSKKISSIVEYSCVIIDECHMNEQIVFVKLLPWIKTRILIGLSASPSPNSPYYDHFFKQIIHRHTTKDFSVFPIFLSFKPRLFYVWRNGKKTFHYTKILQSLIQNRERLESIEERIIDIFKERPFPSLIIAKNIMTVEYLYKRLKTICTADVLYGKKGTYDESSTILLGTYQKMGVGFDTFRYKNLFLLDNLKNIIQAEGRLRNSSFNLYDFVDDHFLFKRHWLTRSVWYESRGASINN